MKNFLHEARTAAGLTQAELAEKAGTTQSQIQKLENGKRKLTKEWAEALAAPLKTTAHALLFGVKQKPPLDETVTIPVKLVPLVGEVAAGRWMELDEIAADAFLDRDIPTVPGRFGALNQFAYRVSGSSMNKMVKDGDYAICVKYWEVRDAPTDSDIVIVERRRGQLVERTCKQLVVSGTNYELWPRSVDPKHQAPIVVPRNHDLLEPDGTVIEIVGRVIGFFNPV